MVISKYFGMTFLLFTFFILSLTAFAEDRKQITLSDGDLMGLAANTYASGELPLGDQHYVTDAPKKGYIFLCRLMGDGGGAQLAGSWIHGTSWNSYSKLSVHGQVTWDQAQFNAVILNDMRDLSGNGLPINHSTGNFPITSGDPVYYYDHNPNKIFPQTLHEILPLNPIYDKTPHCMGGEVGVMLTGVPLFNGFDAGMRDAAAHEAQDMCGGHPQQKGQYHYHSLSPCIKDISEKNVIGYALDGFPITGPLVAEGRYLTTADLDVCHGITSEIIKDGEKKVTYHYVMTQDFPYSVSCFRGTPTRIGPSDMQKNKTNLMQNNQEAQQPMGPLGWKQNQKEEQGQGRGQIQGQEPTQSSSGVPAPPGEAVAACEGRRTAANCGFVTRRGDTITGRCLTPPGQSSLACIPVHNQ